MAAHRYWRLVGFAVAGAGPLELSEVQLYAGGARVGGTVVPTCPIAPASGALADLSDGLATGVVSWPASAHRAPGFALVWDLTGSGSDVDGLRLGSGNGETTLPQDVTLQYSDDAVTWMTLLNMIGVKYPGALALTAAPAGACDAYYENVSLLIKGDGVSGSVAIVDSGPAAKTISVVGDTKISTARSKFGGSSIYFDGAGDCLTSPADKAFEFDAGDFTVELFTYMESLPSAYARVLGYNMGPAATGNESFILEVANTNRMSMLYASDAPRDYYVIDTNLITLNVWIHWAVVRVGSTVTLYRDGVAVATLNVGASTISRPAAPTLSVGRWLTTAGNERYYKGYIDELRITKGVARYYANFTPPSAPFPNSHLLPLVRPLPSRLRSAPLTPERMVGSTLPTGAASSHLREYAFFDAYHGGLGIIYGTVKEKNTPANAPLRRKVWLMDERSGLVIRETWSDAATGAYEFRGIKQGTPYTVLAYDHAHNYRAFAGDNLLPDPLP